MLPILCACSGYWNIKLTQESLLLTTCNSPFGRYRFLHLPFSLVYAQGIFYRKVDKTFVDLPCVTGIADDIVVYGYNCYSDLSDHNENLKAVLQHAHKTGLHFNLDKCKFRCHGIPFFGHIVGAEGLQPDPGKINSVLSMDPSTSLADLQTFLGMVQFLSCFIPNLAASLWVLTKKTSEFIWIPKHQSAINCIKKAIVAPTSLQYFDHPACNPSGGYLTEGFRCRSPTSQWSSGVCWQGVDHSFKSLLQHWEGNVGCPVWFGKVPLCLWPARCCEIQLQTTRSYLQKASVKCTIAPYRITRMMLCIQKYSAQIKYVPGKDIPVTDTLSGISSDPEGHMHFHPWVSSTWCSETATEMQVQGKGTQYSRQTSTMILKSWLRATPMTVSLKLNVKQPLLPHDVQ